MLRSIHAWIMRPALWRGRGRVARFAIAALKLLFAIAFCTLLGLVVGVMVVILPPLAWIGVIGIALLFLLWVMPDLPVVPEKLLRRLFLLSIIVQFATPVYYAVVVPGLPWISFRRLFWFPTIMLAALALAASSDARNRLTGVVRDAKWITVPGIAFFLWLWLSVPTSIAWNETVSAIVNSYLYWAMAFVVCVLCVREEKDIRLVLRILCAITLVAGPMGFIEYLKQDRFIIDWWPQSFIQELARLNPVMFENLSRDTFRNGEFRANFIFNVSLSYGEFLAICAPIGAYFAFHGRTRVGQVLGVFSILMCVLGVFASGSRGGYLGLALGLPFVTLLWLIRHMREQPNSMAGALAGVTLSGAVIGFIGLLIVWKKLRWKFTGGYEGAGSTGIRWLQWEMALPSIMSNPLTGYGHGVGGLVVGYITPGGTPTVDSYVITLLVDAGVPAFVFFFVMVVAAILLMVRIYLTDPSPESSCAMAIAGALLAFLSYRIFLSQLENHFLLFLLLGFAALQLSASRRRVGATVLQSRGREAFALGRPRPLAT